MVGLAVSQGQENQTPTSAVAEIVATDQKASWRREHPKIIRPKKTRALQCGFFFEASLTAENVADVVEYSDEDHGACD